MNNGSALTILAYADGGGRVLVPYAVRQSFTILAHADAQGAVHAHAEGEECTWRTISGRPVCIKGRKEQEVEGADAELVAQADAIAAMDPEKRDNTELGDFPGRAPAYNLYEARKMLPNHSDKLRRITDSNSFSLWQEYDYIANRKGVLFGISKFEDPDEPEDESKFVFAYKRLDRRGLKMIETGVSDVRELLRAMDTKSYAFNPSQPRAPKGTPEGGQWVAASDTQAEQALEKLKKLGKGRKISLEQVFGKGKVMDEEIGNEIDMSVVGSRRGITNETVPIASLNFIESYVTRGTIQRMIEERKDVNRSYRTDPPIVARTEQYGKVLLDGHHRVVAAYLLGDRTIRAKVMGSKSFALEQPSEPKRPLYIRRQVLNADEIVAWAKSVGFRTTIPAEDMHVTICYSKAPVVWGEMREYAGFDPSQPRSPKGTPEGGKWIKAWHGTTSDLAAKIRKEGLKPKGQFRRVFITTDPYEAINYAESRLQQRYRRGLEPVIVVLRVPRKEWANYFQAKGGEGTRWANSYESKKNIPPKWIQRIGGLRTDKMYEIEEEAQLAYVVLFPEDMKGEEGVQQYSLEDDTLEIVGGARRVMPLGEDGAVVLRFEAPVLTERWQSLLHKGASWDYEEYFPHVTLSYNAEGVAGRVIEPYSGSIKLGPEIFEEVKEGWAEDIKEHVQTNFAQVKQTLDALDEQFASELHDALVDSREEILTTLRAAGDDYAKEGAKFKFPNKGGVRNVVKAALQRAWDSGSRDARAEVGTKTFATPSFTPRAAIRWLRDKAFWVTDVLTDGLTEDIRGVLLQALKSGAPFSETTERIAEAFAPYLMSGEQDVMLPAYRLENIVRTNMTEAYNHGRLTEFVRPDMLPFLDGLLYSAILDERTTEVCRFLHEKVFRPNDPALVELVPPNHFMCRSLLVPVIVGTPIRPEQFITPSEVQTAKSLADQRFLEESLKTYIIRHENGKWVLYTRDGSKVLGRHDTREKALAQERAIEANRHR